jgi:hypothetical protein
MTDAEAKALGLRALEAGFQWAPGVRLGDADETYRLTFARYVGDDDDEGATPVLHPAGDGIGPGWGWPADGSGWWPDFRDAATMGVLVAQVRERSKDPGAYALPYGADDAVHWWCVYVWDKAREMRLHRGRYSDEAGAWVAALEAA